MSRPKYPNCIMTPEIINRILHEQDFFDDDHERYERQESEYEERRQQEREQEQEQEQQENDENSRT